MQLYRPSAAMSPSLSGWQSANRPEPRTTKRPRRAAPFFLRGAVVSGPRDVPLPTRPAEPASLGRACLRGPPASRDPDRRDPWQQAAMQLAEPRGTGRTRRIQHEARRARLAANWLVKIRLQWGVPLGRLKLFTTREEWYKKDGQNKQLLDGSLAGSQS